MTQNSHSMSSYFFIENPHRLLGKLMDGIFKYSLQSWSSGNVPSLVVHGSSAYLGLEAIINLEFLTEGFTSIINESWHSSFSALEEGHEDASSLLTVRHTHFHLFLSGQRHAVYLTTAGAIIGWLENSPLWKATLTLQESTTKRRIRWSCVTVHLQLSMWNLFINLSSPENGWGGGTRWSSILTELTVLCAAA